MSARAVILKEMLATINNSYSNSLFLTKAIIEILGYFEKFAHGFPDREQTFAFCSICEPGVKRTFRGLRSKRESQKVRTKNR